MSDSSSSSSVSSSKQESERNDSVTVSDNVVHHDSFAPFVSSLPAPLLLLLFNLTIITLISLMYLKQILLKLRS
jgi:hypothetical protein